MSWVTSIVLIFDFGEGYSEETDMFDDKHISALQNVNDWLKRNNQTFLDNVSDCTVSSAKAMQSCMYAGAFNYLNVSEFVKTVRSQNWVHRDCVQLLIKEEGDRIFTIYTLTD
jgi:hypothetical protein